MNRGNSGRPSNQAQNKSRFSVQMRGLTADARNTTLWRSVPDLRAQMQTADVAPTAEGAGSGTRVPRAAPALRLRLAYDRYLSSVEALHVQRTNAWEIASNVAPQKNVFAERIASLRRELSTLGENLTAKNGLRAEREELVGKIKALEMINTDVTFDGVDKKTAMLFADTASKVIVKNFREMDADDLNVANKMLDEIIELLKSFDYRSKINVRYKLKDLLIQVAVLTSKLNKQKSKCEEVFEEEENLQNYNSSLKILKAQFEENPEVSSIPKKLSLVEEFDKILDEF